MSWTIFWTCMLVLGLPTIATIPAAVFGESRAGLSKRILDNISGWIKQTYKRIRRH